MSELAPLSLTRLRDYRSTLGAEDDRVAYWGRVVQERSDLLANPAGHVTLLTLEDLVQVLGDTGTGRVRHGLNLISAWLPLPGLPEPADTWTSEADHAGPASVRAAVQRLDAAQAQLSGYRQVLHQRLEQATSELISRYRDDPRMALSLIPPE